MSPLNILIHQGQGPHTVVEVRYQYSPLDGDDARLVLPMVESYDLTTVNRVGVLGAFVRQHSAEGIEAAIASLRAHYGALPVQNNIPDDRLDRPLALEGDIR